MKNKSNKTTKSKQQKKLVELGIFMVIGLLVIMICGGISLYKKEHKKADTVKMETKKASHVGAELVEASSFNPPVQLVEAPPINPLTGKHEVDYSLKGEPLYVPEGYGSVKPFMAWSLITDPTTKQFQLRMEAEAYDEDDFGVIGGRYAIAIKPYYGKIADYIDVIQADDSVLHCIIADYKGDENIKKDGELSKYIHTDQSVIEFIVNGYSDWYADSLPRSVCDFHPEFDQNIKAIYNVGNYWGE